MKNINPQTYIDEAIKLENSKGFLEYILNDITITRYEKIAELYNKAANIYKISEKSKAINYFKKVLHYKLLIKNDFVKFDINNILINIAELYLQINEYKKSIKYYNEIINYYLDEGDVKNVIKYYEIIGNLYSTNNEIDKSQEIYYKIIEIINNNSPEKYMSTKTKITEKLCELLIKSDNPLNISNASKFYFDLADDILNSNMLIFQAKKYIFLGLLVSCSNNDLVKTNQDFEKYKNSHHTFPNSNEFNFIKNIIDAINSNNVEKIRELSQEYDKIYNLNNIQVILLNKITNFIDNIFFDNDVNNSNCEYEIDLT